jgi:hypothetical protein
MKNFDEKLSILIESDNCPTNFGVTATPNFIGIHYSFGSFTSCKRKLE